MGLKRTLTSGHPYPSCCDAPKAARVRTLAAGNSVIESRGGALLLTEPSGAQTVVGSVPPRTSVQIGVKIKVRSESDLPRP